MNNEKLYADELAESARKQLLAEGVPEPHGWELVGKRVQQIATKEYPLHLSIITSVDYKEKVDKYVLKFDNGTARCTNEVAEYLLQHAFGGHPIAGRRPVVNAHSTDGVIDAVSLLFISRS